MRSLKKLMVTLVVIVGAFWLMRKMEVFPSFKNIFGAKPVVIDQTPILIKEIKSIGQLITYSSYDEVVADSTITSGASAFIHSFNGIAPIPILPVSDRQLVLIGRGKVLAGTNLNLLNDSGITIKNDTVSIRLPKAEILDAILNPGDFETFVEKGDWSGDEVTMVKTKARRNMIERALQQNILSKADEKARLIMEGFLKNVGYKTVIVL